jgi:ABC-2 type transport system ATP-binding protein
MGPAQADLARWRVGARLLPMKDMDNAIETEDLSKTFEQLSGWWRIGRPIRAPAVSGVTLSVRRGEVFGLLGPNGAGKTTLTKMLCTLIRPSRGEAQVAGYSLAQTGAIRAAVGLVVSDERSFFWRLSGRQNLTFFAALHGLHGTAAAERVNGALTEVDMLSHAGKSFSTYSTGMRQRLAIGRSLLHRPQILFLDEPTRSLDPKASQRLHDLIGRLNRERGVTVFLITHDLAEAEKVCARLAVMHHGRIQAAGSPAELRRLFRPQLHYHLHAAGLQPAHCHDLKQLAGPVRLEQGAAYDTLHFRAGETDGRLAAVLDYLHRQKVTIHTIDSRPASLEEVFAHFTQE